MLMRSERLVCPTCRGSVGWTPEALYCEGCRRKYPFLSEEIPILCADSESLAHRAFAGLTGLSIKQQERGLLLSRAAANVGPTRAAALQRLCAAYRVMQDFNDELMATLEPLMCAGLVEAAIQRQVTLTPGPRVTTEAQYLDVSRFLRRDWSRHDECETEVQAILSSVSGEIQRYAPSSDCILVLGAGTGRFAYELSAACGDVVAIDRSVAMAAALAVLQRGRRTLYEIHEKNVARTADQVRAYEVVLPANRDVDGRPTHLTYVVADALAVPLLDHSVSAIVSIYFTDIVPIHLLLKEASRLLVPGGVFVHYGPLDYHFDAPEALLPADELADFISSQGYRIREERWELLPSLDSAVWLRHPRVLNWCVAATLG